MITDLQMNGLKQYFKKRDDVAFSFLFGSQTGRNATKLSDVDIAVYFYPDDRHPIEYEAETRYSMENRVWSDLERVLKKEVDLLVLNRVSATVATSAIKGVPLSINDWGIYLDFMDFIIRDFMERSTVAKRS